jgi:membrane-associated phospholipid phosphatase
MSTTRRVHELDERLMHRAFGWRRPGRDRGLVRITEAANYSQVWLTIAGGLALLGGARGRRAAGRGAIAVAIAAVVANGPAKMLVPRRRPSAHPTLIDLPGSSSFPSGHSATAFAFATGASLQAPVLAAVLVPLAASVAYSRVHTGVHYPSDVIAGVSIGIACGALAGRRWRRGEHAGASTSAPS